MIPAPTATTPADTTAAVAREMMRLERAATDFEAVMLSTLLKEMRASVPGGESDEQPGGSVLDAMGSQALADGVSKGGGFGIAEILIRDMETQAKAHAADHRNGGLAG